MSRWEQVARAQVGPERADDYAEEYARRFVDAAARGDDVHGEADFTAALLPRGARVLDAGCGTGRLAVRLDELGYDVAGVDVDASMLALARRAAPHLTWRLADLADLADPSGLPAADWDAVVLAGNVVPLVEPGTLRDVARSCASVVAPGGLVVAGFGLDEEHLPPGCPVTGLADWDAACAAAGLVLADRFGAWRVESRLRAAEHPDGYAVSVHRRPS